MHTAYSSSDNHHRLKRRKQNQWVNRTCGESSQAHFVQLIMYVYETIDNTVHIVHNLQSERGLSADLAISTKQTRKRSLGFHEPKFPYRTGRRVKTDCNLCILKNSAQSSALMYTSSVRTKKVHSTTCLCSQVHFFLQNGGSTNKTTQA